MALRRPRPAFHPAPAGKTIQTAVSLQLARAAGLTTGPVAVVVPLSTIGSWEREMARWAPGLEVLSYSGMQEARAIIRKCAGVCWGVLGWLGWVVLGRAGVAACCGRQGAR